MEDDQDNTPRSPIHKKLIYTKVAQRKFKEMLGKKSLKEVPLDFLQTKYFSDVYLLDYLLGAGSFGVVLQVVERNSGQEFAMKIISKKDMKEPDFDMIMAETKMMAKFFHPSVVRLKCVHESSEFFFIVMDLAKAGTLKALIKYRKLKFCSLNDKECSTVMRQILEGLQYIHSLSIVHRDLKPQNILLRSFTQLESAVIIADFGLGIQDSSLLVEKCGTMIYMAPEQLLNTTKGYNKEVDIWAAGIILFMMNSGRHPLYSKGDSMETFKEKLQNPKFEFPENMHPLAIDLCRRLCHPSAEKRYPLWAAVNHPWITRQFENPIPLTIYEENLNIQSIKLLVPLLRILSFLVLQQQERDSEWTIIFILI